ncbi:Belongs to the class-I aminoacyl-tRNA synthetase [Sparganum proliferum]
MRSIDALGEAFCSLVSSPLLHPRMDSDECLIMTNPERTFAGIAFLNVPFVRLLYVVFWLPLPTLVPTGWPPLGERMSVMLRNVWTLRSAPLPRSAGRLCPRTVETLAGIRRKLDLSVRLLIESKWRQKVQKPFSSNVDDNSQKTYVLAMFPYPSGRLHMGHLRVYTVADVLARYYRSRGHTVIFPMGWDAFGLPAENAAIDRSILPSVWTSDNIRSMREQLTRDMLLSIDWTRELSTCYPDYYKWTQWLFIKLYKAGLAYRRLAVVNWDPVDQTVLANELVDAEGRSWRSGAMVTKRIMRQWYFRTQAYSKSLVEGLKEIEGNQWREVIQMQRGWLGPVDGVVLEFDLLFNAEDRTEFEGERIAVYTQQPGLAASEAVSYIAVGSQHLLWNPRFREPIDRRGPNGSRKLVLTNSQSLDNGSPAHTCSRKLAVMSAAQCAPWPEKLAIRAKSLLSDRLIPVVYDPSLRSPVEYETAIDLGVPDLDGHHEEVSKFLDLPPPPTRIEIVSTAFEENSVVIHSTFAPQFSGLTIKDANELAIKLLQASSTPFLEGGDFRLYPCSEHRKDWLVSRQRYWATPIPLIHCSNCGTVPVPESDLPVLLPPLEKAFKRGAVPLKENENWLNTTCPQ